MRGVALFVCMLIGVGSAVKAAAAAADQETEVTSTDSSSCVKHGMCYADSVKGVDLPGYCTLLAPCATIEFALGQAPLSWTGVPSTLFLTGTFPVNTTLELNGCVILNGTAGNAQTVPTISQSNSFYPSSLSNSLILVAPPEKATCGVTIENVQTAQDMSTAMSALSFLGPVNVPPATQPQHVINLFTVGWWPNAGINASNVNLLITSFAMSMQEWTVYGMTPVGMLFTNCVVDMNNVQLNMVAAPNFVWNGGSGSSLKAVNFQLTQVFQPYANFVPAPLFEFVGDNSGGGFGMGISMSEVSIDNTGGRGAVLAIANVTCNDGNTDCTAPIVFDTWTVVGAHGEPNAWFAFDHVADVTLSNSQLANMPGDVSPLAAVFELNGHVGLTLDSVVMFENGATECDDTCYQLTCSGTHNNVVSNPGPNGAAVNQTLVHCGETCVLAVNQMLVCQGP